ncbi:MAG TPA: HYR domain-containing protein, partial [Blastocatellia bacterium]|nr:HYR domain-containing protein [Blastocatellia bacterium]
FTVTVNDNQAPTITCPADMVAQAPPGSSSVAVSFPAPTSADNCTSSVTCVPPSGSAFVPGTTVVNCTATDGVNSTSCSFKVTAFNVVIRDDATGNILRFVTTTGVYEFYECSKNITLKGIGVVTIAACKIDLNDTGPDPKKPDRNVHAVANPCTSRGDATITFNGSGTSILGDANIGNNPVKCP